MAQTAKASPDDTSLVTRVKAGDYDAFEIIVSRYQDRVYGLALSMLRDEVEAQDVVQETFLNVFRKVDTFRGDSAFSSWLYRIAANNAMMKLRGKRRSMQVSIEDHLPRFNEEGHHLSPVDDWSRRVDRVMENKELGGKIRSAVEKLPEKYRIVFLLSDIQDLSMKEVGEALGLSIPNVKTRLHRARLFLRGELAQYLAL